ncbi:MAG: hypothetical protein JST40_00730 [Armatimonadetes bacterium]|nr:hypothetical protein [Armatimonadota bacterium]
MHALVIWVGAVSIMGGIQMKRLNGPDWLAVLFAVFGIVVLILEWARAKKKAETRR